MKKLNKWYFLLPVILLISGLLLKPAWAAAGYADLSEMENGHEISRGFEVDGDYRFVPMVSEQTDIVFSEGWDNLFCRNSEMNVKYISRYYPYADTQKWSNTRSAVLSNDKKGKLSVDLRNVGEYGGDTVNMKVTLTDWTNFTNLPSDDYANAFITMGGSTRLPQINIICVQNLSVRFSYYNMKGEPVHLKGHYTLNDLDYNQGFRILDSDGEIYYTREAASRMGYDAAGSIIWADSSATEPDREDGWITYTFQGSQTDLCFYVNVANPQNEGYPYRKWDVSRWEQIPDSQKTNLERYYKGAVHTNVTEAYHTAWITSEFGYTAEAVISFEKKGNVIVRKSDSQTQEPLAGAGFVCYEWNGNGWNAAGELMWNKEEQDYRIFGLKYTEGNQGKFKVMEVKNPPGYSGKWEQEFTLTEEGTVTFRFQAVNKREKGKITVVKSDAADGSKIDGAVFRITAGEDIHTVGGTVLIRAGTVVDKVTVKNGTAITKELEFGTYLVQEEVPAPGYLITDQISQAALDASNREVSVEFENRKNRVILQKVSRDDGTALAGVEFRIWRKDESEKQGMLRKTDEKGQIVLEGLSPGAYCVRETKTQKGYLIDHTVREFSVAQDGKIDGRENMEMTIENACLELEILKVDAATGEPVSGAELSLYDSEGKVKETWISGKEPHYLRKSEPGEYTLKETKAPAGYKRAEPLVFVLEEKAGVQKVVMKDLRETDLEIVKKIRADEITWAHGNPFFCFTVEGKDIYGNSYRCQCVTEFTREYVESHTDSQGMVEKSVKLTGIPMGDSYEITEQETLRYGLHSVTGTENIRIEKLREPAAGIRPEEIFRVSADLVKRPEGSRVVFENKKYRWDDYSHNDVVENVIPLKKSAEEK